jgi:putative ABC transport system permease protein
MYFTYIRRELRRRLKQSIVVSLGLAVGIGLVMTVSSAASGVKSAQGQILHSLYGVGTDMTVAKTATPGSGGPQRLGGFGTRPAGTTTNISRNVLRASPGTSTLAASDIAKVSTVDGVAAASGGLVLTDTSFSGTIPSGSGTTAPGSSSSSGGSSTTGGPSFNLDSFTVDGIEVGSSSVGPLTAAQVTSGSYFKTTDNTARVAIISSSYATEKSLEVGSTIDVGGKSLTVVGIAKVSSGAADVYIPLGTAQTLAGLDKKITTIFVSASSSTKVSSVAAAVKEILPAATVSTSADLAGEVSGALSNASTLTSSLGRWLSFAALGMAFLVSGLLMMSAVARRVRELGTLKAIGWRTRRLVAQVMGEGIALGIVGGVFGVLLGIAGAETISAISPSLTATVGSSLATGGGFGGPGGPAGAARTVLVHLTAPLHAGTIGLAIVLALAGGLVAGGFGAWRAARLSPAVALRSVE